MFKEGNVFIVGKGEIGEVITTLALEVFKNVYWYDPKLEPQNNCLPNDRKEIDYMHICFPFKDKESFINLVYDYQLQYHPKITIIHSTIAVGVTKELNKYFPTVHSPCRGNNTNMYMHIKTKFTKFVGADSSSLAEDACQHLTDLRIENVKYIGNSKTTELGKLLETSWYGINIAFCQEMQRMCEHYGLIYDEVVTPFNRQGFFDEAHTMQRPWKMFPGFISGHCVIPNFDILMKDNQWLMIEAALKSNERKRKDIDGLGPSSC